MMTLLTVGTHHPFPVPESFVTAEPHGSFARAARYTDQAVAELVRGLEVDGALEDTVVLITADESHGLDEGGDDLTKLLTQNLSFLVAVLPSHQQRAIDEVFVQSDTALSIVDLLGLGDEPHPFIGRSMFRAYAEPRRVFVANQNARTVGMIDSSQEDAWTCDERLTACSHIELDAPSFVSSKRRIVPAARHAMSFIRAAQTRAAGSDVSPLQQLQLTADRLVPVVTGEDQLLYAGQYVSIPTDAVVDVELTAEVQGDGGKLLLSTDLVADAGGRPLVTPEPFVLEGGQAMVLSYSFRSESPAHWVEARALARRLGSRDVAIRISRATLRIRMPEPDDAPGLTTRERSVHPLGVD